MNAIQFFTRHGLPLPRKGDWRVTKRIIGAIHGLPRSHGILCATDGVLCLIEQGGNSDRLFQGHLQFFVPDAKDDAEYVDEVRATAKTPKRDLRAERVRREYV